LVETEAIGSQRVTVKPNNRFRDPSHDTSYMVVLHGATDFELLGFDSDLMHLITKENRA
jgi:hypothetical protein